MSSSTIMGFSKKQFRQLEIVILLNAMALSLVIPSVTSSGELPTTCSSITGGTCDRQTNRHGSSSCIIPATQTSCSKTITFSPSFPQTPFYASATSNQVPPITQLNYSQSRDYTIFAVGSIGLTWTNMPAAKTEIFGDTNFQHVIFPDTANMTQVALLVNCISPSSGASAVWRIQYSTDGAVTWNDITGTDVAVNSCPNGGASSGWVSLPAAAQSGFNLNAYRLVGIGGGGVGDNPIFTMAEINFRDFRTIKINNPISVNPTSALNTVQMTFTITVQFPVISALTVVFLFKVDGCNTGFSSC